MTALAPGRATSGPAGRDTVRWVGGRTAERPAFGALLREWRQRRRVSQLDLAISAEVSARHVSFLETGRGRPSRALVGGVAFAKFVRGVPLTAAHVYTGNLLTLLNPYGLLGGLVTLSLFTLHGAIFLALRTTGELSQRARRTAVRAALAAVPLAAIFLAVTQYGHGRPATDVTAAAAAVALLGGTAAAVRGREGWAFTGTALTLLLAVATLFGDLWPNVMPSSTSAAFSLTVANASSAHYTLAVMTWVALLFTPVVLAYQGWTYWVFRKRLAGPAPAAPVTGPDAAAPVGGRT